MPKATLSRREFLGVTAEVLVKQGQIPRVPDWDAALVREPLRQAMKG